MLKKIVVIGPESTGKSTLSHQLAHYFNTVWVPECARKYIGELNRPYREDDLLKIAQSQVASEENLSDKAKNYLVCDTDLLVIKVWSEHKYSRCHPWILEQIDSRQYDLYLLTYIDILWEDDPQREHPELREYFYELYKTLLKEMNKPFVEIRGTADQRLKTAINAIDNLI